MNTLAENPPLRPVQTMALAFLIGATAFSVDGCLPALPSVADAFGADIATAQLSIGLFMLGYAAGQIPVGLLADRYGRLPVVYTGMTLFFLTALLVSFAQSLETLVALRLLQGAFGATGAVLARTIGRDITTGADTVRLMAFLGSFMGVAMVSAPIIGSAMMWLAGWRASFAVSALFGGIGLILAIISLPETRPERTGKGLKFGVTLFFQSRRTLGAAGLISLMFSTLMAFITLSSHVMIDDQGLSPQSYALVFSVASLGFIGGGTVMRRMARFATEDRLLLRASGAFAISAILLAAVSSVDTPSLALTVFAFFVFLSGVGALFGLATAIAMHDLGQAAGLGAGILGTIQLGLGGLVSVGLTRLHITTLADLTLCLAVMGSAVALYALCFSPIVKAAQTS